MKTTRSPLTRKASQLLSMQPPGLQAAIIGLVLVLRRPPYLRGRQARPYFTAVQWKAHLEAEARHRKIARAQKAVTR